MLGGHVAILPAGGTGMPFPAPTGPPIRRLGPRPGYDLWADTYDVTPNSVVTLDERVTPAIVRATSGERVLDAGCGTGRHIGGIGAAGATAVGLDFAPGMLRVARVKHPNVPFALGNIERRWPFADGAFDAVVCALVGEHLTSLGPVFGEARRVLRAGGRLVFSALHPAMAEAGKEANFQREGVEYRLGAVRHSLRDYSNAVHRARFTGIAIREVCGDEWLAERVPTARRFVGFPMLVVFTAHA